MRIAVEGIPRTGRTVKFGLTEGWALSAVAGALDTEPTSSSGTLEINPPNKGGRVEVHARVAASGDVTCGRCGEVFRLEIDTEAELAYLPRDPTRRASSSEDEEVQLEEEELDVGWYADGQLDLAEVVQEVVALALPPRYTCTDTEGCDARTEALLAAARPAKEVGHPGFAALQKLKNRPG